MDVVRMIEALSSPAAYPHPTGPVEVRQTHGAAVFLAGDFAYKLKKPVRLPFLDYSSPQRRRWFCDEEVRLNRRLAPDVYLGVVGVVADRSGKGLRFEGDGEPLDWAVKMRRLPDEATLGQYLCRDEVGHGEIEDLARRLAAFHRTAETSERIATCGRADAVARLVRDVLALGAPLEGRAVHPGVFARLRAAAEVVLAQQWSLIDARAKRGVPRDCHGDLRLDHVYLFPERPPPGDVVIIDGIEFEECFRFMDPVADVAFLAMDLAFHGRRDLARAFTDVWFEETADQQGRMLLPLYVAYRAMVRGAVAAPLLAEDEVPSPQREAALVRAQGRWLLALGELEVPDKRPCLVLTAGLPGSGKSTLARRLAAAAGFVVIRSDVVRKELASRGDPAADFHNAEWDERTYGECLARAERLLFEGQRVLIDATFREERRRLDFIGAAVRWGVPCAILFCQTSRQTALARLAQRRGDASDAGAEAYERLAAAWQGFGPRSRRAFRVVSSDGTPEHALAEALAALQRLGLHGAALS